MNLATALTLLYAGGPGSGCNPEAAERGGGRCGRPADRHKTTDPAKAQQVAGLRKEISDIDQRLSGRTRRAVRERLMVVREGLQREIGRLEKGRPTTSIPGLEERQGRQTIHLEPPRQSVIRQQFISPTEGYSYTSLQPARMRQRRGPRDPLRTPHSGKGSFREVVEVQHQDQKGTGTVLQFSRRGGKVGEGTTVFVHRDTERKRVVVQEFQTGEYSAWQRAREFKFNNAGRAAGFLNKRYGIRLRLPRKR